MLLANFMYDNISTKKINIVGKFSLKTNILSYFNDKSLKSSLKIEKDDLDEAQIIYSYLKSKSSNCKHAVISEKWINTPNNKNIDKAVAKLLFNVN